MKQFSLTSGRPQDPWTPIWLKTCSQWYAVFPMFFAMNLENAVLRIQNYKEQTIALLLNKYGVPVSALSLQNTSTVFYSPSFSTATSLLVHWHKNKHSSKQFLGHRECWRRKKRNLLNFSAFQHLKNAYLTTLQCQVLCAKAFTIPCALLV